MVKYAEHAARFGRIPTLTPFVKDMGYVEFYNLDIIFILLLLSLLTAFGMLTLFRSVAKLFLAKKKQNHNKFLKL